MEQAKMAFAEYASIQAVNNTALKWFRKSPAHYKAYRDGLIQDEPTAAQKIGTLTHALVLEGRKDWIVQPETYIARVNACPTCGKESEAKKCRACNEERVQKLIEKPWDNRAEACQKWVSEQLFDVITLDQSERIRNGAAAISTHPLIGKLFSGGQPEATLTATCPRTGLLLKARMDYLKPRQIVDLKTAADASTRNFSRAMAKYRYHDQNAFYRYVAQLNGFDITDFFFVALELEPIPMPNLLILSEADLDIAAQDLRNTLDELAECEAEDNWPGYCGHEAHKVTLPAYAHETGEEEALDLTA